MYAHTEDRSLHDTTCVDADLHHVDFAKVISGYQMKNRGRLHLSLGCQLSLQLSMQLRRFLSHLERFAVDNIGRVLQSRHTHVSESESSEN
jgi:hypothetical protein